MKEKEKSEDLGDLEKIEILSTDDQKIKEVGELLSNDSSRRILKLLLESEMTANQIAQKTAMLLSLVIYHLKKMQDVGIVKVSRIEKNTKEHNMLYYTTTKFAVIILPSKLTEKARQSKSLFRSLKRLYKFAAIGLGAATSYLVSQNFQITEFPSGTKVPANIGGGIMAHDLWPIIIALTVIVVGLVAERLLLTYSNKNINHKLKL